ncbi:hypothetical protein D3C71_2190880 [compost metagenome]
MFHRIVMDVVDMAIQVGFIANLVLPEASLPDAFLPFPCLALGTIGGGNGH